MARQHIAGALTAPYPWGKSRAMLSRPRPPRFDRYVAFAAVLVAGCKPSASSSPDAPASSASVPLAPKGNVLQAAENEVAPASSAKARSAASSPRVDIAAGAFEAGSTPGDRGRDPTLEPTNTKIELGGFSIDRDLYPNDPGKRPLTGVTRAKATELCQAAGARLCTELEWERACKGPESTAYPGSASFDPACAKSPASCVSGFGVIGMGSALREWTASDVVPVEKTQPKSAAVRGARADASGVDHRCAHRASVDLAASADDLGFRCCHGSPNAATVPVAEWEQTFRRAELTAAQVGEMLASVPELASLGSKITFFKEPDDLATVMSRGDAGAPNSIPNTTLTTAPILWNPVPGEQILVVAGKAQKDAFIVAFHRLPGDRYRIGSSFVLKDERGPVVLAFNGYVRRKLSWATCWDCPAESGNITYRDDNRVVITQK
jgi:formylglycine-generating enzyme required for sulfatase activity